MYKVIAFLNKNLPYRYKYEETSVVTIVGGEQVKICEVVSPSFYHIMGVNKWLDWNKDKFDPELYLVVYHEK